MLHKAGDTTVIDGASYTYDNAGNRVSKTNYLDSSAEQYVYDDIYQLQQVTRNNAVSESYTYDEVGNRLSSLGVPTYSYNSSNQLTSSSDGVTYTYDDNGNTLTKTDGAGLTQYGWDYENRLTSVTLPGGPVVTFKYDPFGRRIQKVSAAGVTNYVYDGAKWECPAHDNGRDKSDAQAQRRTVAFPLGAGWNALHHRGPSNPFGSGETWANMTPELMQQHIQMIRQACER